MHPFAIDEMIQERRQELARLARVAPPTTEYGVRPWRRRAGRALVALAAVVAVPRPSRRTARCQATTALGFDPPC